MQFINNLGISLYNFTYHSPRNWIIFFIFNFNFSLAFHLHKFPCHSVNLPILFKVAVSCQRFLFQKFVVFQTFKHIHVQTHPNRESNFLCFCPFVSIYVWMFEKFQRTAWELVKLKYKKRIKIKHIWKKEKEPNSVRSASWDFIKKILKLFKCMNCIN